MNRYFTGLNFFSPFLFLLICYHLITNLIWIFASTAPVPWDQAGHTRLAIQFADYFGSLGFLRIAEYFQISAYYPPLIHTIVAFVIMIFGHPIETSEIIITLFFLTSIILLYIYAFDLFKSKKIALISATVYSFLPVITEHSRWFLLEIPLLAFILLALIILNRSRNFTNRKYTKLFFLSVGFAVLTKWTAIAYLLFPFLLTFYKWYKSSTDEQEVLKANITKYTLIFFFMVVPWYLLNISSFIDRATPSLMGESSDPAKILSVENFVFYVYIFFNFQMNLYMGLIFIISAFYFFFKYKSEYKILFGGTMLLTYLGFSLILNKDWRYTLPILPFASIIIGVFLNQLIQKLKLFGGFIVLIVILFLMLYHAILSFRPESFHYQRAIKFPVIGYIDYININDNLVHAYNRSVWPQKEILSSLEINGRTWFLCLVDQERINPGNFLLERDILNLRNLEVESPPDQKFSDKDEIKLFLSKFSYVVVPQTKVGVEATRNIDVFLQLKQAVENSDLGFKKIKSYILPNGDLLDLYSR